VGVVRGVAITYPRAIEFEMSVIRESSMEVNLYLLLSIPISLCAGQTISLTTDHVAHAAPSRKTEGLVSRLVSMECDDIIKELMLHAQCSNINASS
jgi:hypothetical protein